MAEAVLAFQKLQYAFAAHLRNPSVNAPPTDAEDRRMKIYRELFYNNIEGFLATAFPVLRQLTDDQAWHALVRDFYARHQSHDPLFHAMAEEFLHYLDDERGERVGDPPFLRELAHYEWVELALSVAEDSLTPALADPNGDLLNGRPCVSPLAWTLAYQYPVHRISPDFQPTAPGEALTYLVVYRSRADEVKFMEINAVTARLMALIDELPQQTGRELLTGIATELGHPKPEAVLASGEEILFGLRARDIVVGTRREP